MFAMASLLPGKSVFKGIGDLVNKESNRIKEMGKILKQIGIQLYASNSQIVKLITKKSKLKFTFEEFLNICKPCWGEYGM